MLANVAEEYLRPVQRGLNKKLLRTLSKKGLERPGPGPSAGPKIVVDHEDHLDLVSDYAIYDHRSGGRSAIERCLARREAPEGSDERTILEAMRGPVSPSSRSKRSCPTRGFRLSTSSSAPISRSPTSGSRTPPAPGVVLATRVLSFQRFTTTSGAPLQVDREVASLFVDGLREAIGRSVSVSPAASEARAATCA